MKYKILYIFLFLIILSSCSYLFVEQTNQELIEEKSKYIREQDKKLILIDLNLYDSLFYYEDTIQNIPNHLAADPSKFMGSLTEKKLQIIDYGSIKYGKTNNLSEKKDVIEIIESLLFVKIIHGGGCPISIQSGCNLIWDGKHYTNSEGDTYVNLIFSFINPDICRGIIRRTLQFDLSLIEHPDVNKIKINIHGYIYSLYYSY